MSLYQDFQNETDDLADIVKEAVDAIRPYLARFDSIVVTGVSGLLVGSPVSLILGKPLVIIRKEDERAHSSANPGIGRVGNRYLFLDDFVSSGETRRRVVDTIARLRPNARLVGQYEYDMHSLTWRTQ